MTSDRIYNVLFLGTTNSARSIFAEVLLNRWGQGRFKGFSAGSHPKGALNALALELLRSRGLPTEGLHSKSWDQFAQPDAPRLDFVFTVCDTAAGEVCPYWPGEPMTAHWGIEDPASTEGTDLDKRRAFLRVFQTLEARIKLFSMLSVHSLDRIRLQDHVNDIGRAAPPHAAP